MVTGLDVLSSKPWVLCRMLGGPNSLWPLYQGFHGFPQAQMISLLLCGLCIDLKHHQERVLSPFTKDWSHILLRLTVPGECAWISHWC